MKKRNILIVEDDENISNVLKIYLEDANYHVLISNSGNKVVNDVRKNPPDLILLDIMLPDSDGMTICREIRSFSNIPIIMVTARVSDTDRLLGLGLGADDYICKPFVTNEVVARVKAVLRRTYHEDSEDKLTLGPIVIDKKKHMVIIDESTIDLTPFEYQLLEIMMSRPDQVFTRSDFIVKIQGYDHNCYDRTIDNHIKNLRKKIGNYMPDKEIISTVFGVGYKINSPEID